LVRFFLSFFCNLNKYQVWSIFKFEKIKIYFLIFFKKNILFKIWNLFKIWTFFSLNNFQIWIFFKFEHF
jgi:hypothetical protein